jgi:hypothetical protein
MPTRASKATPQGDDDPISFAKTLMERTTGEAWGGTPLEHPPEREKNPAAVALSKLGASKGGKARAEALSARKRKMIAKKAAEARWGTTRK